MVDRGWQFDGWGISIGDEAQWTGPQASERAFREAAVVATAHKMGPLPLGQGLVFIGG